MSDAARLLVIDTATAACSVALFEGETLLARRHDVVGRGHAERLLPMIADLPGGGRAQHILVDVGPGSFTGIRVGIAAARALALGWGAEAHGYSALALIAAAALAEDDAAEVAPELAVVTEGGHGEVFMQAFAAPFRALGEVQSLRPDAALAALGKRRLLGSGTRWLADIDPDVPVSEAWPDAANALLLPAEYRTLPPAPLYGRAPDAKVPTSRAAPKVAR
ncbi:tRNA (adenosine(37)-N6)-threonylcarbamoyltransferase complex dimerization subunit type 1 TsaB [uncultured Sphingomonas sp.]|uniref:tRNA (adenosine(37)-N6)-threonylcarbamoyltransferase complex dimerization subunit type 1 TsaB n=1 Tax=uncultured Sphingomonas sp. TaxID=158754 RepID=UPI0026122C2C|nr:tRNA (adenosine(37)-N6)-threonylcarbamoyltransferase complex dimerization subunit type 1 TsaB [uncultured Sphingomonas sp.]